MSIPSLKHPALWHGGGHGSEKRAQASATQGQTRARLQLEHQRGFHLLHNRRPDELPPPRRCAVSRHLLAEESDLVPRGEGALLGRLLRARAWRRDPAWR